MNKKGIAADATIVAISFIIIATLGVASFSMFGLDFFKPDVEQIVKDTEFSEGMSRILFNFLKDDSDYKGLNNFGLISLYTQNKIDFDVANNKLSKNFDIEQCWFLQVHREGKELIRFVKNGCVIKTKEIDWDRVYRTEISGLEKLELILGVIKK